jgi:hypothetical protein
MLQLRAKMKKKTEERKSETAERTLNFLHYCTVQPYSRTVVQSHSRTDDESVCCRMSGECK